MRLVLRTFAVTALVAAVLAPALAAQAGWDSEFYGPQAIQKGPYESQPADPGNPRTLAPKASTAQAHPFVPSAEPRAVSKQGWHVGRKVTAFDRPAASAADEMLAAPTD